jgi:hypothetical protein
MAFILVLMLQAMVEKCKQNDFESKQNNQKKKEKTRRDLCRRVLEKIEEEEELSMQLTAQRVNFGFPFHTLNAHTTHTTSGA